MQQIPQTKFIIFLYYDNDIALVKTFVKGLYDHFLTTTSRVKYLKIEGSSPSLVDRGLLWLIRVNFMAKVEECDLQSTVINSSDAHAFLKTLVNIQSLKIYDKRFITPTPIKSWEWLAALRFLNELKVLHISNRKECSPPPTDLHCLLQHGLIEGDNKLMKVVLNLTFPSNTIYDIPSPTNLLVDSVLKSVLRSNQIKLLKWYCPTYLMRPWLVSITSYYTVPVLPHWSRREPDWALMESSTYLML